MVDLPKPERRAPSQEEMTGEELLEELKNGCAIQGRKRMPHPCKETRRAAAILQERGVKSKTIKRLMGAYRDMGRYQNQPARPRFPGELPVNTSLQAAMRSAEKNERVVLAALSAK